MDLKEVYKILEIDETVDYKNMSTEEYFHNNKFSIDAFNKKYAIGNETYYQAMKRVCDYIASAEKTEELKKYWGERWLNEILNDYWSPAGSIIQGASNNKKISMMNCTTIGLPEDSLEALIRYTAYNITRTASYRQGLGTNYNNIRPRNSKINNSSNVSSGVVSWMSLNDSLSYYVGQQGRIPAQLMSLICTHPDIEEFIAVKSNTTKIQNANISVQCTNDFYKAAINNDDWELKFVIPEIKKGDKIYLNEDFDDMKLSEGKNDSGNYYLSKFNRKKEVIVKIVKARKILEMIAKGMFQYAEPGVQNIDIARKYSNSDYVGFPIIGTNACCIVDTSKILTNKGWLTICDIFNMCKEEQKNLMAMSYNIENDLYELKPILNVWQDRNDITVELEIEEKGKKYKIECSSDHKILTKNRGYVEATSLNNDDDIIIFA